jgi:hypothetical protein
MVNLLCHMIGGRRLVARERFATFGSPAIASMGEFWHNSRCAAPTGARHLRRDRSDTSLRLALGKLEHCASCAPNGSQGGRRHVRA